MKSLAGCGPVFKNFTSNEKGVDKTHGFWEEGEFKNLPLKTPDQKRDLPNPSGYVNRIPEEEPEERKRQTFPPLRKPPFRFEKLSLKEKATCSLSHGVQQVPAKTEIYIQLFKKCWALLPQGSFCF